LRGDEDLRQLGGEKFGKVEAISLGERSIDIKKRQDTANVHPEAVFAHDIVDAEVLADALVRIGEHVADQGLTGEGPYQAVRDLLLAIAPRMGGEALKEPGERISPQPCGSRHISEAYSQFKARQARARRTSEVV
jgi:hypothetical protein